MWPILIAAAIIEPGYTFTPSRPCGCTTSGEYRREGCRPGRPDYVCRFTPAGALNCRPTCTPKEVTT